jgi:hypothetical protein
VLSNDAPTRRVVLGRGRETGARVIRIPVNWRSYVTAAPATHFDASDPRSPEYRFGLLDGAVRDAVSAGLQPMLVVSHAPAFAEAPHRWPYAYPGSWAPDPHALEQFAVALARRYDGLFADPSMSGALLPRVSMFQAWNEPNLGRYLEPQWVVANGRWQAFSPLMYRQMVSAFYSGIKAVEPRDVVVAAGVAPLGDADGAGRMAPLRFLRTLLCAQPGAKRQAGRCDEPAHFDVLAFHPLSIENPDKSATSSLDVSIADASKVTATLQLAERLHTVLPVTKKQVWVTELNWESAPQSAHGVPPRLQAAWISRALHRLWVARVDLVVWQFLLDPYPSLTLALPTGGTVKISRPAGLYSSSPAGPAGARPKPFLRGFELPFDPLRVDHHRVRVWALLGDPSRRAALQRMHARRWRTIARLRSDRRGVINSLVRIDGSARLRLLSGVSASASARVGKRRARFGAAR